MPDGWRYRRNTAMPELDDLRRRFEDEIARPKPLPKNLANPGC
jgi:hypothetical protein